ncbi:MAG TPA: phage holin family protein [Thermoanaerobaculia bacterium]|jgi:putative membrane protein|nr:phage holin family protein [Thermoanaerobaculia bacterium]
MKTLVRAALHVAVNALALYLAGQWIPGISVPHDWQTLAVAGFVLGLINLIVKPIVKLFSFPFIILTLGLFYLVINGLMLQLAAYLLDSVRIDGCLPAILGGFLVAAGNWFVGLFGSSKD